MCVCGCYGRKSGVGEGVASDEKSRFVWGTYDLLAVAQTKNKRNAYRNRKHNQLNSQSRTSGQKVRHASRKALSAALSCGHKHLISIWNKSQHLSTLPARQPPSNIMRR